MMYESRLRKAENKDIIYSCQNGRTEIDMTELRKPYPSVMRNGFLSYGGSQMWSDSAPICKCGCGIVAALDIAIYLKRSYGGGDKMLAGVPCGGPTPLPAYNELLLSLRKKYFPIIPPLGINQMILTLGMNRFFHDEHLPFTAHVTMATDKMWDRIRQSLMNDCPVLLAIGMNFPYVWQKNTVSFYKKQPDERYTVSVSTKAHFVVITGMDEQWLRISSWGIQYYVNRNELAGYIKKYSTSFISGIVYVTEKK